MNEPIRVDIDGMLAEAASRFGGTFIGTVKYGWNKKSAGCLLRRGRREVWLKVQFADPNHFNERSWNGEILSANIEGICKPRVLEYTDWETAGVLWRALLMDAIEERLCSPTQEISSDLQLPQDWYNSLRSSLVNLAVVKTDRISCRQDLINRRIAERFGTSLNVEVDEWITCHGDLHWANLTCPRLFILDWEGWGLGPKGLDPALLLGVSGLAPTVGLQIRRTFSDWLGTRSGLIALLFVAAELLRMIDLYGDYPALQKPLEQLGSDALDALRCL